MRYSLETDRQWSLSRTLKIQIYFKLYLSFTYYILHTIRYMLQLQKYGCLSSSGVAALAQLRLMSRRIPEARPPGHGVNPRVPLGLESHFGLVRHFVRLYRIAPKITDTLKPYHDYKVGTSSQGYRGPSLFNRDCGT